VAERGRQEKLGGVGAPNTIEATHLRLEENISSKRKMENIQEKYQLLDLTVVNSRYKVSRCRLSNHRQQPSADHLWTLDDQYISYCCGSIFSLILYLAQRPITTIASLPRRPEADGLHRSCCSPGKSERKRPPQLNLELHRLKHFINNQRFQGRFLLLSANCSQEYKWFGHDEQ